MPEVSVLARGSSGHQTWGKVGVGDITVAVNTALVLAPNADWLVMLDVNHLATTPPSRVVLPMVGLSPRQGVMTAERHLPDARKLFPNLVHVGSDKIERVGWDRMPCSILAAIWFSSQVLGGTHLHIHGVDMCGTDLLGTAETPERSKRRWPDEANMLNSVVKAVHKRGVTMRFWGAWKPDIACEYPVTQ